MPLSTAAWTESAASYNNPKFDAFPKQSPVDPNIHRGYMRLLVENLKATDAGFAQSKAGEGPTVAALKDSELGTKLDFQFNPRQLVRSVTARTDTQLWINQSPSQLLQPGIGDMNFQWSMLFNREAEVATKVVQPQKTPGDLEAVSGSDHPLDIYLDDAFNPDKVGDIFTGATADAAKHMGVLADIVILDRITGQSISLQAYNYAKRRYELLVRQGLAFDEDEHLQLAEGELTTEQAAEQLYGEDMGKQELLKANIYNSAFLVPNPIRVVFSQNFMVDGYVNSVSVTFQKFSPEMIPTVCTVDISMHAIYQGFARRRSAFTTFLELQEHLENFNPEGNATEERNPERDTEYGNTMVQEGGIGSGGFTIPMFTGFDHSPQLGGDDDGGTEIEDIVLKGDDVQNENTPDKSHGFAFKNNGISFAVFSRLHDTKLGQQMSKQLSRLEMDGTQVHDATVGFPEPAFKARVYTGLQIRARLVSHPSDPDPKASMAALFSGNHEGFTVYENDNELAPFFGDWTVEQRRNLLQVGYDNMGSSALTKQLAKSAFGDPGLSSGQFSGSAPYYTQSFPILNDGASDPAYGDQLYMKSFDYNAVNIHWDKASNGSAFTGTPFVHMTLDGSDDGSHTRWGPTEDDDDVPEDPIKGYLANGFFSSNANYKHHPFLEYFRLTHSGDAGSPSWHESGTGSDIILNIEYQINVLYKVILWHGDDQPLSDTGWLVVQPRWDPVAYIEKGTDEGTVLKDSNTNAHPTGLGTDAAFTTNATMVTGRTGTHWIRPRGVGSGMKNLNLHWDGYTYDKDGGGIHQWPRTLWENRYSHGAAYFRQRHEEHGKFRKSED